VVALSSTSTAGTNDGGGYDLVVPSRSVTPFVLAIDIGASSIKMADVTDDGEIVGSVRRRTTPYPCTPERLTALLAERITKRGIPRVGVGFPGEFRDGVVISPANLARPQGFTSAVDQQLDAQWRGFPLQQALNERVDAEVRVLNDASLAALGSATGQGRELVLTLGTGFGVALVIDGALATIPDYGQRTFFDGESYDHKLGEHGRAEDPSAWLSALRRAIAELSVQWDSNVIHLGGGNSQRLRIDDVAAPGLTIVIQGNAAPLRGAARLFLASGK